MTCMSGGNDSPAPGPMGESPERDLHVPPVTIGMPVFNGASFLEESLSSLLQQTEGHLSILVSDNCSTDGTPQICAAFAARDSRITYVRQRTNLGATKNFEFVLKAARSPFFMWASHDDLWDRGFIREGIRQLHRAPNALGFATDLVTIDERGDHIGFLRLPRTLQDASPLIRARAAELDGNYAVNSGLFRRERIPGLGGRPLADVAGGDVAFIFRLALHGSIVIGDQALVSKRVVGYREILLPDGQPGWEKSLGSDGHLYSHNISGRCHAMLSYVREAPLDQRTKLLLRADIRRSMIRNRRWLWANGPRLKDAWRSNDFKMLVPLVAKEFALAPRATTRRAAAMLLERLKAFRD